MWASNRNSIIYWVVWLPHSFSTVSWRSQKKSSFHIIHFISTCFFIILLNSTAIILLLYNNFIVIVGRKFWQYFSKKNVYKTCAFVYHDFFTMQLNVLYFCQVEILEIGRSDGSYCMRQHSTTMWRKVTLKKKRLLTLQKVVEWEWRRNVTLMTTGQEMQSTVLVWLLKEEPGTSSERILQMLSEYNILLLLLL